jgi:hypothetical protein
LSKFAALPDFFGLAKGSKTKAIRSKGAVNFGQDFKISDFVFFARHVLHQDGFHKLLQLPVFRELP